MHVWEVCVCVWVCYIYFSVSHTLVSFPDLPSSTYITCSITHGTCMMLTMICAGVGSGLGPGTKTSHTWDEVIYEILNFW